MGHATHSSWCQIGSLSAGWLGHESALFMGPTEREEGGRDTRVLHWYPVVGRWGQHAVRQGTQQGRPTQDQIIRAISLPGQVLVLACYRAALTSAPVREAAGPGPGGTREIRV